MSNSTPYTRSDASTSISFLNRLGGFESKESSDLFQAIVQDETSPSPSWIQRLLCDCGGPRTRVEGGIQDVPEISNLAGLMFQNGDEVTSGTAFTLKWADFDKEKRVCTIQVYGGYGSKAAATGLWSILDNHMWRFLSVLGRCCNYTYRISFSEDWQRADFDIKANLGCICCAKPWFTLPHKVAKFEMVQAENSQNGSHWLRNSSVIGRPMEFSYNLETVYKPDGTPTEFIQNFENDAPKSMLLSR
eukprot:CAMPEP_0195528196 /NCGR_PEP_ID=MMETSP0794_2-20130614/30245_1 /TAXON_ID=515487 /ORGANISM="Stephanopyxis turris, Strain CCMP 815" /LENGTH=245 /DNA_ID=CAMNT_0040659285 /DNA_START=102 /DNA_END=839 /DNA_ORIENTATION=-